MIWLYAGLAAKALSSGIGYNQQAKEQQRQNKSTEAYNAALRAAYARQLTEINIQRSVSRAQTAQALDAARRQGMGETSARNLQAAASDTMGASVGQNMLDVSQQLDQAEANLNRNAEVAELSFDSQVASTVDNTRNAIKELSNPLATDWAGLGSMVAQVGTAVVANKMEGKDWLGNPAKAEAAAPISKAVGTPTNLSTRLKL